MDEAEEEEGHAHQSAGGREAPRSHSHDGVQCTATHGDAGDSPAGATKEGSKVLSEVPSIGHAHGSISPQPGASEGHSHSHDGVECSAPPAASDPHAHSHADDKEDSHSHSHSHSHNGVPCTSTHGDSDAHSTTTTGTLAPVSAKRVQTPAAAAVAVESKDLSGMDMVSIMFKWLLSDTAGKVRTLTCIVLVVFTKLVKISSPVAYEAVINTLSAKSLVAPHYLATLSTRMGGLAGGGGGASLGVLVAMLVALHGGFKVAAQTLQSANDIVFSKAMQPAVRKAGEDAMRGLLSQELAFHLKSNTGATTRIVDRGLRGISAVLSRIVLQLVPQAFELALVASLIASSASVPLAGLTIATVLSYGCFTVWAVRVRLGHLEKMNSADNQAMSRMLEGLLGVETVTSYNRQEWEVSRYKKKLGDYQKSALKSQESLAILNWGQNIIESTGGALMLFSTASLFLSGQITLGRLIMLNLLLANLMQPLDHLGANYMQLRGGLLDAKGLLTLMNRRPALEDSPQAQPLKFGGGKIEFRDVHFGYPSSHSSVGHGSHVLCGFTLNVEKGQTVGIVGESGSGKSTVARLLGRAFGAESGEVLIDGQDVMGVSGDSVRDNVAVVLQDSALFDESLMYNIQYGREGCSEEEAMGAARAAQLGEVVTRLSDGYRSNVGERGGGLSGGQRQRVSLARALVKDAGILVLDEATSSVDSVTEASIIRGIAPLRKGKTTIMIAHRLTTVMRADAIAVLHKGRVVEQGTHEELLRIEGGRYATMWSEQERGGLAGSAPEADAPPPVEVEDLQDSGDSCGCASH